nr:PREDICTED: uncharacterized protein LOC100566798 isoform X2 [Anolis carolinensis]|eukprot:XP_008105488.1 PREDICTED: uncharacterized protein LOC100566798 isoform X2 [Anolis carolinensis]
MMENTKSGSETQGSVDQNSHLNFGDSYVTQLAYGDYIYIISEVYLICKDALTNFKNTFLSDNDNLMDMDDLVPLHDDLFARRMRLGHNPEQAESIYLHKRQQLAPSLIGRKPKEPEYEDGSVIYEYDPNEGGNVVSGASYSADHDNILMEVLNYCQATYDAIQKLDKKIDSLHQMVSEMQHTHLKQKPVGFTVSSSRPPVGKIHIQKSTERRLGHISSHRDRNYSQHTKARLQRPNILSSSSTASDAYTLQPETQHPAPSQSPPLPKIVSIHSLCSPCSMASKMPDFPSQIDLVNENLLPATSLVTASPVVSSVMPSPPPASLERSSLIATNKALPRSINTLSELPSSPSASVSPAIASSSSLYLQISTAGGASRIPSQASPANLALDSSDVTSSAFSSQRRAPVPALETNLGGNSVPGTSRTSSEYTDRSSNEPSSSLNHDFEFVGDPKRKINILRSSLREAKQKARPWKAASSLVRLLFPKETLAYSAIVTKAQGRRTLDPNKIAAIRGNHGRDRESP